MQYRLQAYEITFAVQKVERYFVGDDDILFPIKHSTYHHLYDASKARH